MLRLSLTVENHNFRDPVNRVEGKEEFIEQQRIRIELVKKVREWKNVKEKETRKGVKEYGERRQRLHPSSCNRRLVR